ncbi:MAG: histidine phosphatase family protein [Firmicutes bacterium]|nr:histidine phosphatase family protein [Bacillota bacterium]
MSSWLLVRHAETEANLLRRYQGWTDSALTAEGHAQEARVLARLSSIPVQAVYSSDLPRARRLAESIAAVHHLRVQLDARLREMHFGRFERLSYAQIMAIDPATASEWYEQMWDRRPPGGESAKEVFVRMQACMSAIGQATAGSRGSVVVVSHGGPLRMWLAWTRCADARQWSRIQFARGEIVPVQRSADTG